MRRLLAGAIVVAAGLVTFASPAQAQSDVTVRCGLRLDYPANGVVVWRMDNPNDFPVRLTLVSVGSPDIVDAQPGFVIPARQSRDVQHTFWFVHFDGTATVPSDPPVIAVEWVEDVQVAQARHGSASATVEQCVTVARRIENLCDGTTKIALTNKSDTPVFVEINGEASTLVRDESAVVINPYRRTEVKIGGGELPQVVDAYTWGPPEGCSQYGRPLENPSVLPLPQTGPPVGRLVVIGIALVLIGGVLMRRRPGV
jgi:hypothetical protein